MRTLSLCKIGQGPNPIKSLKITVLPIALEELFSSQGITMILSPVWPSKHQLILWLGNKQWLVFTNICGRNEKENVIKHHFHNSNLFIRLCNDSCHRAKETKRRERLWYFLGNGAVRKDFRGVWEQSWEGQETLERVWMV